MSEKKLSISKKTVLIASALVLAVGLPIAYLLWTSNQEDTGAWYNSSWLYRRSISVANPGSTLTNEDVLIEYDTATLVTAGKLQSDCDDLRFVDSDDATALAYWVEGGCNTSTTHIWVRIPSLTSGGKTIYMYYGNSSATNAEETWTGKFYLMKDAACDSGWTAESGAGGDFNLKFPYPASTFGTTGGASSHDHGSASLTTDSYSTGSNTTEIAGNNTTDVPHTHSVSVPIETNSSVLPPYLDMVFCSNNDLVIKQNGVAIFTSSVSSPFTQFSALDSAFPRGNSSYTGTQGGATTHTHTTTQATTGSPSATTYCAVGTAAYVPTDTHTHTFASSTTTAGNHIPTYMTVIFGQAGSDTMAPSATIVMSNNTPPLGWTRYSALDGYFTYGATSYGTTGGNATHTHDVSLTSGNESATYGCVIKSNPKLLQPRTHSHTASGTTGTYSNNPPYISTLFIQKKTSQSVTVNNEEVPNQAPNAPSALTTEGSTNPTGVTDLTPEFSSLYTDPDSDDAAYYQIEVNTASDFTGTVMWDSTKTPATITHNTRSAEIPYGDSDLTQNGTTYYWRMKYWDDQGGESSWSSTANFTMSSGNTAPDAPSSLQTEGATNPTKVEDTTPEFSAVFTDTDTGDTGIYYEIEVNSNNSFTGTVMWDSGKQSITSITNGARSSDISYGSVGTPETLTFNGATYYWRMKFWDNNDVESSWSSTAQFTMASVPNAPTSLQTETATNPTGVTDLTPEFSAIHTDADGDSTTHYEIEVNSNNTFTGTVMWDTGQQTITVAHNARSSEISYGSVGTPETLTFNGATYYWRIRFWDTQGVSDWSSTAQFTMASVPNTPTSLQTETATNPTGVTDLTPEFSAVHTDADGDSTTHYEIEVNTLSNFTGTVMWDTGQQTITVVHNARSSEISYGSVGTSETLTLNGTTYYWRIRFWDTQGVSDWSSTAQFTMYSNTAPNAPGTPYAEGSTNPVKVTTTTPVFSAIFSDTDASDTGNYYQIEVNTASDFTGTVMWDSGQTAITPITNGSRSSNISYGDTDLTLNGVTYYWRIKFWDNYDTASAWSSTAQFTMSGPPNAPSSLYAEGLETPSNVTDVTPEFSAIHTDPNGDSATHYEIEVNTQSDFLGTSMWDSNQQAITVLNNDRSSDISYNGTALYLNSTTYYWRIRFWDTISTVGDWSSVGSFTMATNIVPNAPTSLLTETATNPTKVTDTTPEFSAIFSDTNSNDTGIHYEIEVNTTSDFTGTVMWHSNQQSITPITNGSRSSDIPYAGTTLTENGITYYWRIKFWDSNGGESSWSSVAQFTMSGPPNTPSSLYTEGATNPTGVTDTTPEFSAIHADPNGDSTASYQIQVNTQSDFLGTSMWDSTQLSITVANNTRSSDISYNGTTLTQNGTTYYWRIKFWDTDSKASDWSSTGQFTMAAAGNTAPDAPSSLYAEAATNPIKVEDTTPEFSAIHTDPNEDSTTHYEIEVNTASNFTGTVMWDSNQQTITVAHNARSSDISYNGSTLNFDGTTYYWRIRFWDSISTVSDWSSTGQFTMHPNTVPNAPSSPYTEAATNPTKVEDTTPEFSAVFTDTNGTDTGTHYEIEVNSNNSFTGTVMWDSGKQSITSITNGARSSDISYGIVGTPETLTLNGATYYWRMKFWDNYEGESSWSSTASFTMSGPPNAPSSLQTEGSTNPTGVTDLTPEFSAIHTDPNTDSTTHYEIEVNTQSDFLGTSMWDTNQQTITVANNARSSEISYDGTTLTLNGTTYYWRIRFWDSVSTVGDWSSVSSFTMGTNTPPNAPSSLYTETTTNPTKVEDTTPEFSAIFSDTNGSDTGTHYEIEVNTSSDFTGTVMWDSSQQSITAITNGARSSDISYGIIGTPVTLTFNGATYYWRIKFWDNNGSASNWSSTGSFTMSGPPAAPSNLKTDNMTNPTQILSTTPDFKAYHLDPNGDSATYYEIEVNTQSDFLGTSMWDTGQVAMTSTPSGQYSPDITYAGTTLTGDSSTTYYWRIRFWDSISTVSEWSSTASFVDFVQEEQYIQMEGVGLERIKIN